MVRQRTGTYFDPDVAGAYLDLAGGLWPDGDQPVPLTDVLSCAPGTPVDELPGDRRLAVCEALADFADLKSARRGPHSHRVASLAARAASGLGLPAAEQERLRRAGLVHDLGKIAVPYRLLEQAGDDTDAASRRGGAAALAEPVRLHPYYAQRILSRVGPLADLAADVGAHHERLDGSGYPLGLAAPGIPIGARVLAAADAWAERAAHGPPDLTGEDGLDPACIAALRARPGPVPVTRVSAPAPIRAARPQLTRAGGTAAAHRRRLQPRHQQDPAHQPAHRRAPRRARPRRARRDQPHPHHGLHLTRELLAARLDMLGRLNRDEDMPGIEQSVIPAATGGAQPTAISSIGRLLERVRRSAHHGRLPGRPAQPGC